MTPEQAKLAALKIAHHYLSNFYNDPTYYLLYSILQHGGQAPERADQLQVLEQLMEIMDRLWREYQALKEQE